jgi:hypothetical protein
MSAPCLFMRATCRNVQKKPIDLTLTRQKFDISAELKIKYTYA